MEDQIIRNPLALNEDALGDNFPEVPNPRITCGESIPTGEINYGCVGSVPGQ